MLQRRLSGALTAVLFAAYLIALSPHLAHHLLDDQHERPTCPYLAQNQSTPAVQGDCPTVAPPAPIEALQVVLPAASLPSLDPTPTHPRAPPRSAIPA